MEKISVITDKKPMAQSYKNIEFVSDTASAVGDRILFTCGCDLRYEAAEEMLKADGAVVYCDEKIGGNVFFKPEYSPHTLLSYNYIGPCLIKREYVYNNKTVYENLKMLSDKGVLFKHIHKVLAQGNRVPEESKREKNAKGRVSIIIPSKDNYNVLERCIKSIREKSTYRDYEIIVADNGSSSLVKEKYSALADKYIYYKTDFNFSRMCNMGAERAEGEHLLFLNDDTQVISPDWLEKMVSLASLDNTGAVGAKLLYPDSGKIQHCGIINISNGPVHAFIGQEDSDELYFGMNRYDHNCIAVTAACLCIEKEKFQGFDQSFKVAYNDVDLCFSLYEKGLYNVVCNEAVLLHFESLSRGNDLADKAKMKRLLDERKRLYRKHIKLVGKDPFYSRRLTQLRADHRAARKRDMLISAYKNIRLVL